MYTGTMIEDLVNAVQRAEQGARLAQAGRPVTLRIAPKEIGRTDLQAFFYHMHAMGQIQVGVA